MSIGSTLKNIISIGLNYYIVAKLFTMELKAQHDTLQTGIKKGASFLGKLLGRPKEEIIKQIK